MSTVAAVPSAFENWAPIAANETQRILLHCVSWEDYCAIRNALMDRPALRMTYDQGELEIMGISRLHEYYALCLGRLIEVAAEESEVMIAPGGNMTFQREDLARGLESDNCFWVAHEREMRSKGTWDPLLDPPPDLVLEVEVSRSALNKMHIYAALRVPEVWRADGTTIAIFMLRPDGSYERVERSLALPKLPVHEFARFMQPNESLDYLSVIRSFRAWVRQQLGKKETP